MLVGKGIEAALNEQIGHELAASLQYVAIAAYCESENLGMLAKVFYKQSDEEREHALKLVDYLVRAGAKARVPAIPESKSDFSSVEEAVRLAVDWELQVTGQFNSLMELAIAEKDHLSQAFLAWFVTEQLEEVSSMTRLHELVQRAGNNLLMVEAYLIHGG